MDKYVCVQCGHKFKLNHQLKTHINKKCDSIGDKIDNIIDDKVSKKVNLLMDIKKDKKDKKDKKYKNGQYFTTNEDLKKCVFELIHNNSKLILEPSVGQGDLVEYVIQNKENIKFDLYEIDKTIKLLKSVEKNKIIYGDFLNQNIKKKYSTIIGNPPYVKTKNGNLYLDFIEKCYNLLKTEGELIFIVPSDFIKLTSSSKIINKMMDNGTFTHIIHPNNESLFENASIDIIIFRFCKTKLLSNKILVNNVSKYLINTNGILTYSDTNINNSNTFSDYFDIFVGMVTGKENVFKNAKYGNIKILNGKDKIDNYILINEFPTKNNKLNKYMLSHKNELINRKIKKFNENNWFEWGALRNYNTIQKNLNNDCIYIKNLSRNTDVCFQDKVQYFGGGLIIMIPKEKINLQKIVKYINTDAFKSNYMYSGRFKIGHKQLCNALFNIPTNT
jgi:adenine-specific DNA-methyltransferase